MLISTRRAHRHGDVLTCIPLTWLRSKQTLSTKRLLHYSLLIFTWNSPLHHNFFCAEKCLQILESFYDSRYFYPQTFVLWCYFRFSAIVFFKIAKNSAKAGGQFYFSDRILVLISSFWGKESKTNLKGSNRMFNNLEQKC